MKPLRRFDCSVVKPSLAQRLLHRLDEGVGHIRDDEILPDGQPDFARAVEVRDLRDADHLLRRDLPDGHGDADVVEARLLLRIDADVRVRKVLARVLRSPPDRAARAASL